MSDAMVVAHGVMRAADARRFAHATLPFGDLAAVVSRQAAFADDDAARTLELAERHHALLCEIAGSCDVLPLRLGAAFVDEAAATLALQDKAELFAAGLARLAGAVELSLIVEDRGAPEAPEATPADGRDYLKARGAALAAARARPASVADALDRLEAELAPLSQGIVRRPAAAPRARDFALLVQRGATVDVFKLMDRRRAELAALGLDVVLRGPWPVYSFASISEAKLS